jgi:beta-lactamase regulating signal transducer with metallopeptidase domain
MSLALHQKELFGQIKRQHLPIYVVNFLGMIWLAGIFLMTIRFGYGLSYTRKMISRLPKLKHDRLSPVLDDVMDVFGAHSPPDIYASVVVKSPQTIGLFSPCIVLSSDLLEKTDEEELKSILLHEMSHIYHNDQWAGVLQRIISIIFWWNPLTHRLSADFSHEREYVCDMYVNRHGNPKVFANCLFHLARHAQAVKLLPTALCAMTSTGILEKRIQKILSGGQIMKTTLSAKTSLIHAIISIIVAGLLLSVNLTMAGQQSSPKEKANADQATEMNSIVDTERAPSRGNAASNSEADVTLNSVDTDIIDLVETISKMTGKTFIIDRNLKSVFDSKGKVNVVSPDKFSPEEAYHMFESVLEENGFALVPSGDVIKVVLASEARN